MSVQTKACVKLSLLLICNFDVDPSYGTFLKTWRVRMKETWRYQKRTIPFTSRSLSCWLAKAGLLITFTHSHHQNNKACTSWRTTCQSTFTPCQKVTMIWNVGNLPLTVKLQVAGHLAIRDILGHLLQLEHLEVHALALVWHNEEWVQGALGLTGTVTDKGNTQV